MLNRRFSGDESFKPLGQSSQDDAGVALGVVVEAKRPEDRMRDAAGTSRL
jgi:hypothetical protein